MRPMQRKNSFFQQACCCSVCFEMGSIDHQPYCGSILFHKLGKYSVEGIESAPFRKATIESFVWPYSGGHLSIAGRA